MRTIEAVFEGSPTGTPFKASITYVTDDRMLEPVLYMLDTVKEVALDLETSGLHPHFGDQIATLQLAPPPGAPDYCIYVIDWRMLSAHGQGLVLEALQAPTLLKVGQNLKFEARFLGVHHNAWLEPVYDTQLAEVVIHQGLWEHVKAQAAGLDVLKGQGAMQRFIDQELKKKRKGGGRKPKTGDGEEKGGLALRLSSMARLAARYLGINIDKDFDLRTSFYKTPPGQHSDRQLIYAAGDVVYPFWFKQLQAPKIAARGLQSILRHVEFPLIPILAKAEMMGMRFEVPEWLALADAAEARRGELQAALDAHVREVSVQQDLFNDARPINPFTNEAWDYGSDTQVKDAIGLLAKAQQWPVKPIFTKPEWNSLKQHYGKAWLADRNAWLKRRAQENGTPYRGATVDQIPDHLVPETQYCNLTSSNWKALTLAMVRRQIPAELAQLFVQYSKNDQLCSTYGRQWPAKYVRNGTAFFEFHQALAATGRLSANPNSMALPRDGAYRACFRPRPGYKFVIADLSQIEPRLTAAMSGDPVYVSTFQNHQDIYKNVGEGLYEQPIVKGTEQGDALRQNAKVAVLSLGFGMRPPKFRNERAISLAKDIMAGRAKDYTVEESEREWNKFFETCPGIRQWQYRQVDLVTPRSEHAQWLDDELVGEPVLYIKAMCGRIRSWTPDMGPYADAMNHPIQGSAATGMKRAMVLLTRAIREQGFDAQIVNVIHDELVTEVREDQAEALAQIQRVSMIQAFVPIAPHIPIEAEFPKSAPNGVADRWVK